MCKSIWYVFLAKIKQFYTLSKFSSLDGCQVLLLEWEVSASDITFMSLYSFCLTALCVKVNIIDLCVTDSIIFSWGALYCHWI